MAKSAGCELGSRVTRQETSAGGGVRAKWDEGVVSGNGDSGWKW